MRASYTLIVGPPALTAGVFTPTSGRVAAKWETHKLQNRDNHPPPPPNFWKALA